ncbi:hypothetical protein CVE34_22775, partial [Pseudomonas syringae pv. actinidiae]|nr:hypothetical protein [Pseudomonas syringae pv. actinidiae]
HQIDRKTKFSHFQNPEKISIASLESTEPERSAIKVVATGKQSPHVQQSANGVRYTNRDD